MYPAYFDTTELQRVSLVNAVAAARNQNERVMAWFSVMYEGTPSQARAALPHAPITSVRRAITTLERNGQLRRTDRQQIGPYGRPEYVWALPAQGRLF